MKAFCPYCSYELTCDETMPGLNCPACDCRIIIRNGEFHTIESAKKIMPNKKTDADSSITNEPNTISTEESFLHEIDMLIVKNKKMEAMKLYQKSKKLSLLDATKYIKSRAARLESNSTEIKRICTQCSKAWHSLIKREKALTTDATLTAVSGAGNCCNPAARLQANRNSQAINDNLTQLRRCPSCGSAKYTETIIFHDVD